jgi:hypothetical protein
MLTEVLYIPQAALHLISISHLANNDLETMFNKTKCVIRNPSGNTVAGGTHKGRELYSFDGTPRIVKHALIARAVLNLLMWHKCLGHINYAVWLPIALTCRICHDAQYQDTYRTPKYHYILPITPTPRTITLDSSSQCPINTDAINAAYIHLC